MAAKVRGNTSRSPRPRPNGWPPAILARPVLQCGDPRHRRTGQGPLPALRRYRSHAGATAASRTERGRPATVRPFAASVAAAALPDARPIIVRRTLGGTLPATATRMRSLGPSRRRQLGFKLYLPDAHGSLLGEGRGLFWEIASRQHALALGQREQRVWGSSFLASERLCRQPQQRYTFLLASRRFRRS